MEGSYLRFIDFCITPPGAKAYVSEDEDDYGVEILEATHVDELKSLLFVSPIPDTRNAKSESLIPNPATRNQTLRDEIKRTAEQVCVAPPPISSL